MSNDQECKKLLRRAYRVARKEGHILRKSRRAISPENRGELMLVDPSTGAPVLGWHYDASPEEIIVYFALDHPEKAENAETSPDADELPAPESDDPYGSWSSEGAVQATVMHGKRKTDVNPLVVPARITSQGEKKERKRAAGKESRTDCAAPKWIRKRIGQETTGDCLE